MTTSKQWLLGLGWLALAVGCSETDNGVQAPDAGAQIPDVGELPDGSVDAADAAADVESGHSGLAGECTSPIFFDRYPNQTSPTQLVSCPGDKRGAAPRVDLVGSRVGQARRTLHGGASTG
ncbi:MAG: hypothetical protein KIT72_18720 [Polyangiaceae bacterium]|nr:hypothetical protein [Polyangiaceae bacterium]